MMHNLREKRDHNAKNVKHFCPCRAGSKEEVEKVLDELGLSMSNAVGMFLRQVILQRGIPFDAKLPGNKPAAAGTLTNDEL